MDIRLSDRMQMVADLAEGHAVADIGCDHGYVSIYLVRQGKFDKAIAMDLREGPLKKAREHVAGCGLLDRISIRLSDGFEKLQAQEADCAVIAGMGGILMTEILKRGRIHTDNGIKLVLQPQSDYYTVRKYLMDICYEIMDEVMLFEEGKYYAAIKAKSCESAPEYSKLQLKYGPVLIKNKPAVFVEYMSRERIKIKELIEKLRHIYTDKANEKLKLLEEELKDIESVLDEVN